MEEKTGLAHEYGAYNDKLGQKGFDKSSSVTITEVDTDTESTLETDTTGTYNSSSSRRRVDAERLERERQRRLYEPMICEIVPGLLHGNIASLTDESLLKRHHVKAVVIIGSDQTLNTQGCLQKPSYIPQDRQKRINHDAHAARDLRHHLGDICDFIERFAVDFPIFHSWRYTSEEIDYLTDNGLTIEPSPRSWYSSVLITTHGLNCLGLMLIYAYYMRRGDMSLKSMIDWLHSCQKLWIGPDKVRQLQIGGGWYLSPSCMDFLNTLGFGLKGVEQDARLKEDCKPSRVKYELTPVH